MALIPSRYGTPSAIPGRPRSQRLLADRVCIDPAASYPRLQVHDEFVLEAPQDHAELAKQILVEEMTAAFSALLPARVDAPPRACACGAELGCGEGVMRAFCDGDRNLAITSPEP